MSCLSKRIRLLLLPAERSTLDRELHVFHICKYDFIARRKGSGQFLSQIIWKINVRQDRCTCNIREFQWEIWDQTRNVINAAILEAWRMRERGEREKGGGGGCGGENRCRRETKTNYLKQWNQLLPISFSSLSWYIMNSGGEMLVAFVADQDDNIFYVLFFYQLAN